MNKKIVKRKRSLPHARAFPGYSLLRMNSDPMVL